ncbi:hypothetical protein BDW02DRAFT_552717 [Decorospora gaudefroyi]|uniref:Rhodopsin domain-containing protein n=1 Tax=Decorospora gaudefroyi TaxID=184978 RepID=A0A6A5KIQ9_9PLEO|nr:hypothetical protein BDW02DRAFT_552717 [Decorospora gaudefroyi]
MSQPIFPPPTGYVVDLENPQRTGVAANMWVGIMGMMLSSLFMGVRIYTKTKLAKNFTADDGALLLAWIPIQIPILCKSRKTASSSPKQSNHSKSPVRKSNPRITVASILYCPFLASAKFSLLFFYLRLSHLRWFRICVYASMFLVVSYSTAFVFPLAFACTPVKRNWDVTVTEGSYIDRTPLYMATAVLNMVTDILLLVLPMPMVFKLHMPRAQKAGLTCIFSVGSLTCITSGVRLALLSPMLKTMDLTWGVVLPGIWILIEANLVIITGCLPNMRLFFRHVAPRLIGESYKMNGYTAGSKTNNSELQTIGSKHTKNRYDRMEEDGVSVGSGEGASAGCKVDEEEERGSFSALTFGSITRTQSVVVESVRLGR